MRGAARRPRRQRADRDRGTSERSTASDRSSAQCASSTTNRAPSGSARSSIASMLASTIEKLRSLDSPEAAERWSSSRSRSRWAAGTRCSSVNACGGTLLDGPPRRRRPRRRERLRRAPSWTPRRARCVLPMPASPSSATAPPAPATSDETKPCKAASSSTRPTVPGPDRPVPVSVTCQSCQGSAEPLSRRRPRSTKAAAGTVPTS